MHESEGISERRGRVLIVGAGPTGLMLAVQLALWGVIPRVIDKRPTPSDTSKALAVFARSLELLDQLDLADTAIARGRKLREAVLFLNGQFLTSFQMDEIDSPFRFVLSLPQSETERLLEEKATDLGVQIDRSTALVSMTAVDDRVDVTLQHEDGSETHETVDWVVGCDGAHSRVREEAGIAFEGSDLEIAIGLADVTLGWDEDQSGPRAFFDAGGVAAAIPLPEDDRWRVIVDLPHGESLKGTDDEKLSAIERLACERTGRSLSMRDPGWVSSFLIRQRKVTTYRRGRVILAGDAAHAHSPLGGQGMNTGLQDAANLGWKLATVIMGRTDESLLDTYQQEREPIAKDLLRATEWGTRAVTFTNPVAQVIRNQVARFAGSIEVVQQRLASQLSELRLNYCNGPLAREHHQSVLQARMLDDASVETPTLVEWFDFNEGPRAGDRCPDCRLHRIDGTRLHLHDLLRGPRFVLLLFDGETQTTGGYQVFKAIAGACRTAFDGLIDTHAIVPGDTVPKKFRWVGSKLLDHDRLAHRRFGASAESLYLIRPDGYIGYRSQPAELDGLMDYLRNVIHIHLDGA